MANLLQRQSSYRSTYEHSSLSQPAAECSRGIQYQFRTLPRQRPNHNQVVPAASVALSYDPSNARRQLVSNTVADYLKSLNSMTRSIVLEKEFVEEKHAGEWPSMDETEQEEVVDEHFMPMNVHAHYGTLPRSRPASRASSHGDPEQARHHDEALLRNRPRKSSVSDQPTPEPASPPPQHPSTAPTYFIPPTHNRLHKNQLSYRSNALRKVMNIPPAHSEMKTTAAHQSDKRDSGLGSDGESPRTSDEDLNNTLAFQRNHLRSYSLRHGKCAPRNPNSLSRSSTRRTNRLTSSDTHSPSSLSKNRHQYDSRYDEEVDLPDESLLLDHVSPHQSELVGSPTPPKPSRYSSQTRRSRRMQPRVLADEFSSEDVEENGDVIVPKLLSRVASNDSGSTVNNTDALVPFFHRLPTVMLPHLRRAQSEDSIDTDIDSIAPSNMSNLSRSTEILTEDEIQSDATTIRTCLTPDSIIFATSPTATPTHKGLVRSRPQSLRGGSFYETSTSEFAKRRAQFKPNMLRNQLSVQNSPAHTRQSTPSFSRQSTPSLSSPAPSDTPRDQFLKPFVKSPPSSLSMKHRCGSAGESVITSEHLTSPEFLSQLSSPPHTPVVKSIIQGGELNHLHVRSESQDQKRESGYISSSSESFAFSGRR